MTDIQSDARCVTRLALRQYKSVEQCDLDLAPLTILVGRNGAGKSNIIDSLRFVADALRHTLEYAIRERGGIDHVRRKSLGGRPTHPAIAMHVNLPGRRTAEYSFKVAAAMGRNFRVAYETCIVRDAQSHILAEFRVIDREIKFWSLKSTPPVAADDRLYLVAVSGEPEFRPVFDVLTRMTFHNLNPEVMKNPQRPEPGELLAHDGRNLASVVKSLEKDGKSLNRVIEYLRAIGVPLTQVQHKQAGVLETIEVAQEVSVPDGRKNSHFEAIALSDGTIRAVGILVSIMSARGASFGGPTLIGIEEPETALHPAAAGALMDALTEGAEQTQLLVTCHSPDLLDHELVTPEMIRPVVLENERTRVGRLSTAKTNLLQEHLTAGELLRLDQLTADEDDLRRQEESRGTLWESMG